MVRLVSLCCLVFTVACRQGKSARLGDTGATVNEDGGGSSEGDVEAPDDTGSAPDDTASGTDDTGGASDDTGGASDDTGGASDDTGTPPPVEICDGLDNDGDGEIDEGFDSDADGVADCFDSEECDGVDNDGDGEVDEGFDSDADGVADCFDSEECDGVDNDGDGEVDEGFDSDSDGVADCFDSEECDGLDNDGDGEVDEGFDSDADGLADCFDPEVCDGVDNDGDGEIDEAGAYGESTWYADADADGHGDAGSSSLACEAPPETVSSSDDCDDGDAAVHPGAIEVCNGYDDDCDHAVDEGLDHDADGIADCFDTEECDGIDNDGDGEVDEGFPDTDEDGIVDCLDYEECDGLDNDGDGEVDEGFDFTGDGSADCTDDDGDGISEADGDCDDGDDEVYPGAEEVDDGKDNDCDGEDLISVLFELSHGEATWSDPESYDTYTGWGYAADIIDDMGAIWGRLDTGPVTAEALDGWDMLVVAEPTWAFSASELTVIEDYVEAGGGLLLATDYNVASINPLADRFQTTFTGWGSGWFMLTEMAEHPITEDVDNVYIANGSSLVAYGEDVDVVGWAGDLDIIAATESGLGGVVFVADNEVFSYYSISFSDNDTFLERIITWLARD